MSRTCVPHVYKHATDMCVDMHTDMCTDICVDVHNSNPPMAKCSNPDSGIGHARLHFRHVPLFLSADFFGGTSAKVVGSGGASERSSGPQNVMGLVV